MKKLTILENWRGRMGRFAKGPVGTCICPECGYETEHSMGEPCDEKECFECGSMMTRK